MRPILPSNPPPSGPRRPFLLLVLVAVVGLGSGLLGAAAGARLVPPRAPAQTAVVPATAASGGDTAARIRRAIDRGLPTVVTVVADLAPTAAAGGVVETTNLGSGVVIAEGGLVITNYHVVAGASAISIVLQSGERRPAILLADDSPFHDLAVLRVPGGGLRAAPLGDSNALLLGDPAIVISSGLVTYANQVKVGVVSAKHVDFPRPGIILEDMVQTDAAVNHGDSGGALLNLDGEVVGLVTTVVRSTPSGQAVEGVALVHSMSSMRPLLDAIVATGINPRPRLGIERLTTQHTPIDPARPPAGFRGAGGALVTAVAAGSPAAAAGITVGDVVAAVNGQPVGEDAPFVNLLGAATPGRDVRLTLVRGGRERQVIVSPQVIATVPSGAR